MLDVATWLAPRLRSIQVRPVVGLVTSTMAVAPAAQNTLLAGYWAWALTVKEHDCPPNEIAKLAVPALAGVPVMVYVTLPLPLAKVPAANEAVRPVTPVEATFCALYEPALPPV